MPRQTSGEIQRLRLEHGWSPVYQVPLNDVPVDVKCMTTSDVDKLTNYLLIIEAQAGVK